MDPAGSGVLLPWLDLEHYCRFQSDLTERQRMLIVLIASRDVHYCWPQWRGQSGSARIGLL